MIGWPKPSQQKAAKQAARRAAKAPKRAALKPSSPYQHPAWRKKVREVRKRSKGICEARVKCNGDPVQGDPHHKRYAPGSGVKRLLVPLTDLLDCCHRCHKSFHPEAGP